MTLTKEQQDAVAMSGRTSCLIAGPGSGKTRVLIERIIRETQETPNGRIAVVTFTNAAAGEIRDRLNARGIDHSTFYHLGTLHSMATRALRRLGRNETIADRHQTAAAIARTRTAMGAFARNLSTAAIWRFATNLPQMGNGRTIGLAVRKILREQNLTAHDFILTDYRDAIKTCQCYAPQWLAVDEFQDTSPVDADIYDNLARLGTSRYFVGDPRQAIYGFRGSDPVIIGIEYNRADQRGQLTVCHRSGPEICQAVTAIAERMESRYFDTTVRPADTLPGRPVRHLRFTSQEHEIVNAVDWATGQRGSAAILTRYNSTAARVAHALRGAGLAATSSTDTELEHNAGIAEAAETLQTSNWAPPPGTVEARTEQWRNHMLRAGISLAVQDALMPRLTAIATADDLGSLDQDQPEQTGTLAVSTIHSAKGREWDAVLVLGADNLALPGRDPEAGRMAFVAASRARYDLDVTWATSRTCGESGRHLQNLEITSWMRPS